MIIPEFVLIMYMVFSSGRTSEPVVVDSFDRLSDCETYKSKIKLKRKNIKLECLKVDPD